MALGIAVSAVLLNVSQSLRGADRLALADFRIAFFVVGLIAVAASALFLRLDADAGPQPAARNGVTGPSLRPGANVPRGRELICDLMTIGLKIAPVAGVAER